MDNFILERQTIQSSFSPSDVDGLTLYFKRIWMSDATYKVVVARRAFNLNQVFVNVMSADLDENCRTDNIISDTALLLCAEEISGYYRVLHSFPSILIADDILVHGRRVAEIISSLESLIVYHLKNTEKNSSFFNQQRVHRELLRAITIYVYAENANDILLGREYNIISEKRLRYTELKCLSQQISRAIQSSTVRNTNYVLSVNFPSSEMFGSEDASMFRYRGRTMQFMYRSVCSFVHETARTYKDEDKKLDRFITFSVLFGDTDGENSAENIDLNNICVSVSEVLTELYPNSIFACILKQTHRCYFSPKVQALSFLLSMICSIDFYTDTISKRIPNSNDLILQSDYLKIASNFDYPNRIRREIVFLFNSFCRDSEVRNEIHNAIVGSIGLSRFASNSNHFLRGSLNCTGDYWNVSKKDHYKAEDIFYEIGLESESEAKTILTEKDSFNVNDLDANYIDFSNYIKNMKCGSDTFSKPQSIGCLLNLMDSGLVGTYYAASDREQRKLKTYLKAGELSTFSLARRFSVFIPALAEIEAFADRNDYNVEDLIVCFVDYLTDSGFYFLRDSRFEQALLEELRDSVDTLLYMCQAGQKFRDWDISLLTKEDMESFGLNDDGTFSAQKYFRWIEVEPKLEHHYVFCAKTFLRSCD